MTLAVSHIAWSPEEDADAYSLLREFQVGVLEIAPGRWWPEPAHAPPAAVEAVRSPLEASGFIVGAFQAILFGRPELRLFESAEARDGLLVHLQGIARSAALCGAGPIVFGAPQQRRIPVGMTGTEVDAIALPFLAELARTAVELGVCFCLEPNPVAYGTNYLTHAAEVADLVRRIASPGVRLQIDAGELAMNEEDVAEVIRTDADLIGHVHISQPMLATFEEPWPGHQQLATELRGAGYAGLCSLEMKRGPGGLADVRQALEFARSCYGRL